MFVTDRFLAQKSRLRRDAVSEFCPQIFSRGGKRISCWTDSLLDFLNIQKQSDIGWLYICEGMCSSSTQHLFSRRRDERISLFSSQVHETDVNRDRRNDILKIEARFSSDQPIRTLRLLLFYHIELKVRILQHIWTDFHNWALFELSNKINDSNN